MMWIFNNDNPESVTWAAYRAVRFLSPASSFSELWRPSPGRGSPSPSSGSCSKELWCHPSASVTQHMLTLANANISLQHKSNEGCFSSSAELHHIMLLCCWDLLWWYQHLVLSVQWTLNPSTWTLTQAWISPQHLSQQIEDGWSSSSPGSCCCSCPITTNKQTRSTSPSWMPHFSC